MTLSQRDVVYYKASEVPKIRKGLIRWLTDASEEEIVQFYVRFFDITEPVPKKVDDQAIERIASRLAERVADKALIMMIEHDIGRLCAASGG